MTFFRICWAAFSLSWYCGNVSRNWNWPSNLFDHILWPDCLLRLHRFIINISFLIQVHAGHNYNLIKMHFRPRSAKLAFLVLANAVIIYYQNQCFYNVHFFSLAINCILLMLTNLKSLIRIVFVLNLVFNLYHTTSWTVVSIFRFAFIGKVTKELIV